MTAGALTPPNDPSYGWLRPPRESFQSFQLTPTIGSRSAPGAASGTTGFFGSTGAIRTYAAPTAGRPSTSPLLGQNAMARSAWAVMVSDGFTPRLAETVEPSTTWRPS